MSKPAAKKPAPRKPPVVVKRAPQTLQERVEKWFLPVMFVVIGALIVGTLVNAFMKSGGAK